MRLLALPLAAIAFGLAAPLAAQTSASATTAVPDTARLAAGTRIAAAMMPPGTYRKLLSGTFNNLMTSMINQMGDLPIRDLVAASGVAMPDSSKLGPGTLQQVMAVIDPAYKQRQEIMTRTMMDSMSTVLEKFEPTIREGIAESYANHFTAAQLADLERFFATPTGKDFAGNIMLLNADPAVMNRMQAAMPEILKMLPAMMVAVQDATKDLPKAKQYKDLTPAERSELATLLGMDPKELK